MSFCREGFFLAEALEKSYLRICSERFVFICLLLLLTPGSKAASWRKILQKNTLRGESAFWKSRGFFRAGLEMQDTSW